MDLPFPETGSDNRKRPLADRMRPQSLDHFVGQDHIVGQGTLLRRSLDAGRFASGTYFLRVDGADTIPSRKFTVVK